MSLIFTYQWTTEAFLCHFVPSFFPCLHLSPAPSWAKLHARHLVTLFQDVVNHGLNHRSTPPSWGFLKCWETPKMGYPWSKLDGLFLKGNPILKWMNFMGTSNDSETSSFLAFCSLAMEVTAAKTLGFSKSDSRSIWLNIMRLWGKKGFVRCWGRY